MEVLAIGVGLVVALRLLFGGRDRSSKQQALDIADELFDISVDD